MNAAKNKMQAWKPASEMETCCRFTGSIRTEPFAEGCAAATASRFGPMIPRRRRLADGRSQKSRDG